MFTTQFIDFNYRNFIRKSF